MRSASSVSPLARRVMASAGVKRTAVWCSRMRDERLDDAFRIEAEVLQASAERPVGLADVGGAPLIFRPRRPGGDHDRVVS